MRYAGLGGVVAIAVAAAWPSHAIGQLNQVASASGHCSSAINNSGSGTVTVNNYCGLQPAGRATVDRLVRETIVKRKADHRRDKRIAEISDSDAGQNEQILELREKLAQAVGTFNALATGSGAGEAGEAEAKAQELLAKGDPSAAADLLGREAKTRRNHAELNNKAAAALFLQQSALLETQDLTKARVAANQALKIDPQNLEAIYRLESIADALGRSGEALQLLERYVGIANDAGQSLPPDETHLHRLADVQIKIADLQMDRGEIQPALAAYGAGQEAARQLVAQFPDEVDWKFHFAGLYARIGEARLRLGELDAAEAAYSEMLRFAEQYDRAEPNTADFINLLAQANIGLGEVLQNKSEAKRALERYEAGLKLFRTLNKLEPQDPAWQRSLALTLIYIGNIKKGMANTTAALRSFEEGVVFADRLIKQQPGNADALDTQAILYNKIGLVKKDQQDFGSARENFAGAVAIRRRLVSGDPDNTDAKYTLALALNNLAGVQAELAGMVAARATFLEARTMAKEGSAREPAIVAWTQLMYQTELALGDALAAGDPREAERCYRRAIEIAKQGVAKFPQVRSERWDLATAHARIGFIGNGLAPDKRRHEIQLAIAELERLGAGGEYEGLDAALSYSRAALAKIPDAK